MAANSGKFTRTVPLNLSERADELVEAIKDCGLKHDEEVFSLALSILTTAVLYKQAGWEIVAIDGEHNVRARLEHPLLSAVAKGGQDVRRCLSQFTLNPQRPEAPPPQLSHNPTPPPDPAK